VIPAGYASGAQGYTRQVALLSREKRQKSKQIVIEDCMSNGLRQTDGV